MAVEPKSGKITGVVVLLSLVVLGWGLYSTFSGSGPSEEERAFVIEHGAKGTASLLAVERIGNTVNNIHQYAFTFRVQPDSGAAFEITQKKLIDPIYMSGIKIGMVIPSHSIPGEEEGTVIHWERVGVGDAF